MLFPGAVIPASLVTEVNSESPGPVIAQVTQSIYDSATGRTLLIPQGARLIGDYRSSSRYGQSRVAILWSRLIMPNGDEIALDEAAVDPSGAADISIIDSEPSSENFNQVVSQVGTGSATRTVAVTPDGTRIYLGTEQGYLILSTVDYGVVRNVDTGTATRTVDGAGQLVSRP